MVFLKNCLYDIWLFEGLRETITKGQSYSDNFLFSIPKLNIIVDFIIHISDKKKILFSILGKNFSK